MFLFMFQVFYQQRVRSKTKTPLPFHGSGVKENSVFTNQTPTALLLRSSSPFS